MNQFITLLRKDWRVNRELVIILLLGTLGSYVLASLFFLRDWYDDPFRSNGPSIFSYVQGGATLALVITALPAAGFGGKAFAAERRDKTADFLATLPVPKMLIIASKLALVLSCLGASWLLYILVAYCASGETPTADFIDFLTGIITFEAAMFGLSWMLSTFLESAAISTSISIAVISISWLTIAVGYEDRRNYAPEGLFIGLGWCVALLTLTVGSFYYARRVAP